MKDDGYSNSNVSTLVATQGLPFTRLLLLCSFVYETDSDRIHASRRLITCGAMKQSMECKKLAGTLIFVVQEPKRKEQSKYHAQLCP